MKPPIPDNEYLYVSVPQVVEAIQWDGTYGVLGELNCWSEGATRGRTTAAGWQLELFAGKDGAQKWVPVPVGHWVVRQPGDLTDHWPIDPDYFARKYERYQEDTPDA